MTFWLNPAAFRVPALGTFGNYYRNNLTYVPEWSFDMALSRTFRVSESNRFEIRAEAWDRQIEGDVTSGRLDALADEAIQDLRAGRCTER